MNHRVNYMQEKRPYEMTREEWLAEREAIRPDGMSRSKYNGKKCHSAIANINRLTELTYGVEKWLHDKALAGDANALDKLRFGYDTYTEIIKKHAEEKI